MNVHIYIESGKVEYLKRILDIVWSLDPDEQDDITYQNFLINHFIELNVFQLFSNLNSTILEFNETEYNDKIKKFYINKTRKVQYNVNYKSDKYLSISKCDIFNVVFSLSNCFRSLSISAFILISFCFT